MSRGLASAVGMLFFAVLAAQPPLLGQIRFQRGDANGDGKVDISDSIFSLGCQFLGSRCPECLKAADANDDGRFDLADAIYSLSWIFRGGPILPPPGPFECGTDPTPDALPCASFSPCPQGKGAEVHGYVYALVQVRPAAGLRRVLLPDVEVWAKNTATAAESPRVQTDLKGFFVIPVQPPGTYDLCLDAPGFVPRCGPERAVIHSDTVYVELVEMVPIDSVVGGTVTLADGSPGHFDDPLFGLSMATEVRLLDDAGDVVPPVRANSLGEFVLAGAPAGNLRVQASCEESAAEQGIEVSRRATVELTLPNRPPVVRSVVAFIGARGVRRAAPGAEVEVRVEASDPDDDVLHYRWAASDSREGFVSQDQSSVFWRLPESRGLHQIYVLVTDGRCGVALGRLALSTHDEGAYFTGTVFTDDGPVDRASVTVSGFGTTTSSAGFFELLVPGESDRYVLSIVKEGFQLFCRVLPVPLVGGRYELVRSQRFVIDPSLDNELVERPEAPDRPGSRLRIPANTLVDAQGQPPAGNLNVYFSSIDLRDPAGRFPGEYGGVNLKGVEVALTTFGAVDIQVFDDFGREYNLVPGVAAAVRIAVDPGLPPDALPPAMPLWFLDAASGLWREDGVLSLEGGFYEGAVSHFSVLNADVEFTNPACIRIQSSTATLKPPFQVRVTSPAPSVPNGTPSSGASIFTSVVADPLSVVVRLPPNTNVQFQVLDQQGSVIPSATQIVSSGAPNAGPAFPPYPYSSCNGQVVLSVGPSTPPLPTGGFLNYYGLNTADDADLYYSLIDPVAVSGAGTVSSSGTTVSGSGTAFTSFFVPGDIIRASGKVRTIGAVLNNTTLVTESAFSPALAAAAYERVGAKTTLASWKAANGFNSGDDAKAVYLNAVDLCFGRGMHLKKVGQNVAYYVSNFPTVDDARLETNLIATVAMEYSPLPSSTTRITKFYVFNSGGARVNKANLDNSSDKYLPKLCQICHAGNVGFIAADLGARFIGFDLEAFQYSQYEPSPGVFPFERAAQEPDFKVLNQRVLDTNVAPATQEIIEGWYGGPGLPNATQNSNFVAAGWKPPVSVQDKSSLYLDVVKPACRTCHATRVGRVSWDTWDTPAPFDGFKESGGGINYFVCTSRTMPHAKTTYLRFWQSFAPYQPQALASGGLDFWTATGPCP
jgi:hypothetical protein